MLRICRPNCCDAGHRLSMILFGRRRKIAITLASKKANENRTPGGMIFSRGYASLYLTGNDHAEIPTGASPSLQFPGLSPNAKLKSKFWDFCCPVMSHPRH